MADGDYLETENLASGDSGLGGLLADLLNQWEEDEGVPLEAQDQDDPAIAFAENEMDAAAPVESTLAQLAEAAAIESPEPLAQEVLTEAILTEPVGEGEAECEEALFAALVEEAVEEIEAEPAIAVAASIGEATEEAAAVAGSDIEPPVIEPVLPEPDAEPEMVARIPFEKHAQNGADALCAPAAKTRAQKNEELLEMVRSMYQAIQQRRSGGGVAGKDGYVVVRLGDQQYGISIRRVVETDRMPRVTAVPLVPDFVPGVVNLRGEVLPLVDMRRLLGLNSSAGGRMVVIRPKEGEGGTALLVDGLAGIAWLDRKQLQSGQAPGNGEADGIRLESLVSATGLHRDRQLGILDLDRLFASKELMELRTV